MGFILHDTSRMIFYVHMAAAWSFSRSAGDGGFSFLYISLCPSVMFLEPWKTKLRNKGESS